MKRPICPLCGVELQHEYVTKEGYVYRPANPLEPMPTTITLVPGPVTVKQEEQVQFWVHNPRSIHEDILVTAHKACYDKAKAAYPSFDVPTEKDWGNPRLPVIGSDSKIILRPLSSSLLEKPDA